MSCGVQTTGLKERASEKKIKHPDRFAASTTYPFIAAVRLYKTEFIDVLNELPLCFGIALKRMSPLFVRYADAIHMRCYSKSGKDKKQLRMPIEEKV